MEYYVYILTNWNKSILYIGVTNDISRRLQEHKDSVVKGFTKKYHVDKLVYCESTNDIGVALEREKQLKKWTRKKKNDLISKANPRWEELEIGLL